MNNWEKQWPIGALVKHKELGWTGRIIGNNVTLGHCEVSGLEVHFYLTDPPDIKYTVVIPAEVELLE